MAKASNMSPSMKSLEAANAIIERPIVKSDSGHQHGTFGIEFYDADGAFVGHAEISDEYLSSVVETVQSETVNPSPSLEISEPVLTEKLDNLATIGLVLVVALFMVVGAVSILTLVRSLRLK